MGNDRRAGTVRDGDQVVQRRHLAGVGADVVAAQVAGRHAEGLVGLRIDAIGAVVVIEVVDVLRAHEDAERIGDLREWNAHRLGLFAVDGDQYLRVVGREGGHQAGQVLVLVAGAHNLVSDAVQIGERVAALILEHELEAAVAADAGDGRRLEDSHQAAVGREHQALQFG